MAIFELRKQINAIRITKNMPIRILNALEQAKRGDWIICNSITSQPLEIMSNEKFREIANPANFESQQLLDSSLDELEGRNDKFNKLK